MSSATRPLELPAPARAARSLAFRLTAWYAAVFAASLVALAVLAVPITAEVLRSQDTVVLESRLERHAAVLSVGLPQYQRAVEQSAALGEREPAVRVRDGEGRTVYQHGDVGSARVVTARVAGAFRVELGYASGALGAVGRRLQPVAVALLLAGLLLSAVGGLALARKGLAPVRALAAAARAVSSSGDLSRRVPERGTGDELDELSVLFNRMLERNQALVGGMRAALDDVAHDLRTPLTRLRGTAEVALRGDDPPAAREALALCIEESDRVLAMLRTLMDISEAETGLMRLDLRPVPLGRLAREVKDLYELVAEQAGVALEVEGGGDGDREVTAQVDAVRLRQALANLVDNAVKYTPRGGRVSLEVAREGADAVLRVRDTGAGIPPEARPRIFDRLYRAEPSRSKPGLGLGLSLVRAIVAAHGGRVDVESSVGRGSVFTVRLPG